MRDRGGLSESARKRVAERLDSDSDDDEFTVVVAPHQSITVADGAPARRSAADIGRSAADIAMGVVREEFAASFGAVTPPAAAAAAPFAGPASELARLEEENRALTARLDAQQAVNVRLEQRCEVASADAASHLRDLVELEEEGRGFDAAHAALLAKSDEQAQQLQESETALLKATGQLEDLRRRERHSSEAESQLRREVAQLRRRKSSEVKEATELEETREAELSARNFD